MENNGMWQALIQFIHDVWAFAPTFFMIIFNLALLIGITIIILKLFPWANGEKNK